MVVWMLSAPRPLVAYHASFHGALLVDPSDPGATARRVGMTDASGVLRVSRTVPPLAAGVDGLTTFHQVFYLDAGPLPPAGHLRSARCVPGGATALVTIR